MRQNDSKHWKWTRWVHLNSVRKYNIEIADPGMKLVSKYRVWEICWKSGKCSVSKDSLFGIKAMWFPFLPKTVHPKHSSSLLSLLHSIACLSFSLHSITFSFASSWVTIFLAVFHSKVQSHQDIFVRSPLLLWTADNYFILSYIILAGEPIGSVGLVPKGSYRKLLGRCVAVSTWRDHNTSPSLSLSARCESFLCWSLQRIESWANFRDGKSQIRTYL